jgi:hypothetical protein
MPLSSDDIDDITFSDLCGQTDPTYHDITIKLKDGTQVDGEVANATQLGYLLCYIGKRGRFEYVFDDAFYHGGLVPHKGRWPWSSEYVYLGRRKILLGKKRGEIPPLTHNGRGLIVPAKRTENRRWC